MSCPFWELHNVCSIYKKIMMDATIVHHEHVYKIFPENTKAEQDQEATQNNDDQDDTQTWLTAPTHFLTCDFDSLSKDTIHKIHEQMMANWKTLGRNDVILGIPVGTYCIERIRHEKKYRRAYEAKRQT